MYKPSSIFSSFPVLSARESNREKEEEDEKVEKEDFTVHLFYFLKSCFFRGAAFEDELREMISF